MERRRFFPALLAATAGTLVGADHVFAQDDENVMGGGMDENVAVPKPRRGPRGIMADPRFEALSMDGKRLIEYARPLHRKLPRPGPQLMQEYLLAYDRLTDADRAALVQLISYVEYMTDAELARYLGADAKGRVPRQKLAEGLRALAHEPRIPYHTGPKVVVTAFGPWADRDLPTAPPSPELLPRAARELLPHGEWYPNVTGAASALPAWTQQVLLGGTAPTSDGAGSLAAVLQGRGIDRRQIWSVLGPDTNAAAGRAGATPYFLTTRDAEAVDEYLGDKDVRKRMRKSRDPEERKALRQQFAQLAKQAMRDLQLAERYPDLEALHFIGHVLFHERGVKDRGNTFVHVGALRAMQLLHPRFLYVQFGGPDATLRARRAGRTFGEQGAVGQGQYSDADYLSDLDEWSYYHWLETRQHPHYAGEATFVLLFGPQGDGRTQAIVSRPGVARGRRVTAETPLAAILDRAVATIA